MEASGLGGVLHYFPSGIPDSQLPSGVAGEAAEEVVGKFVDENAGEVDEEVAAENAVENSGAVADEVVDEVADEGTVEIVGKVASETAGGMAASDLEDVQALADIFVAVGLELGLIATEVDEAKNFVAQAEG